MYSIDPEGIDRQFGRFFFTASLLVQGAPLGYNGPYAPE